MSKEHSCCSSTCTVWQKENRNLCSPICHCGLRCAMRTAKTLKNRGKQFWGCSKYKSGAEEGGCNYFKWFNDVVEEERGKCLKCEGNKESSVHSEEMDKLDEGVDIFGFSFMCNKFNLRINVDENGLMGCNRVVLFFHFNESQTSY
ncbi:uncharacterized protein LOC128196628 [Vigna angularis]|uniref:uncharacterized protein LOC128196628 n=1 Tax=Phaseolus angularis TaxID=3914 RepID=UPI0022B41CA5|nr:uncharacterized protein LOC128196628 [Vigna angularis]